jgi:hypothetical protein
MGLRLENECAGEDQQQQQTTDPSSRQRGCYTWTMTADVRLKKKSGRESQGTRRHDELIGGIQPVANQIQNTTVSSAVEFRSCRITETGEREWSRPSAVV